MKKSEREFQPETVLKEWAHNAAETVVFHTYVDGYRQDIRKKPTKNQREIMEKIIYGALLGLNWGETNRSETVAEDAILNAAEYMCIVMLPEVNSYDSVYIPLRHICKAWPKKS